MNEWIMNKPVASSEGGHNTDTDLKVTKIKTLTR